MSFDFELIDAHVHPFLKAENNFRQYETPATPEQMVSMLRAEGVSMCCGSTIQSTWVTDFEVIRHTNADACEFAEKFPGFLVPGVSVHAAFPRESCEEIERRAAEKSLHWIGELVVYMVGSMQYSAKTLFPVYDLAQKLEVPVNIHPADADNLEDIVNILTNFPKLPVVLAHPCEKRSYLAKIELMKQFPNLYQDLSGTGLFRWGMLAHGVKEVGAERFLFGSDFPICNVGMNRQAVLSEGLSDGDNAKIFAGNFRRLAKI